MTSRRWFSNPLCLLLLVTALIAFVVQSGELGTADTMHRLQSTHALWTSEPPVFPQEYPEFGVHGRGGKLQSWYGIGQSLLMLPADIVGTYVERLPIFADYNGTDPSVRNIIVSYSTNILVDRADRAGLLPLSAPAGASTTAIHARRSRAAALPPRISTTRRT